MKILVTGANGFIGEPLCQMLSKDGHQITAIIRTTQTARKEYKVINADLSANINLQEILKSIDIVVHLAGRAHVLNDKSKDPYQAYAEVNIEATKSLALQAAANGVKRFMFISSVKVNGEETTHQAYSEKNIPKPQDDYGKTKHEAEIELLLIAANSCMEVVIIRPPLVYGKGVKANFHNLMMFCQARLPLPFGAIHNKRSMVYIENLIDFIVLCSTHPKAANEIFLVSDDEDVSTTTLIRTIRTTLGLPSLLLPIPQSLIVFMLNVIGKKSLSTRLCGNLQVDITKAKTLLGWKPPFTFEQGIKNTIQEK